jgi:hypothetical protein
MMILMILKHYLRKSKGETMNDTYEFDTTEDIGGGGGAGSGNYCKVAGWYHATVATFSPGRSKKGEPIKGIYLEFDVSAGTVEGQENKIIGFTLWDPKLNASDAGKLWAAKKRTNLLLAVDAMKPSQIGGRVTLGNYEEIVSRQVCLQIDLNDGGYAELAYADIYHVDDPACEHVPKSAPDLSVIPAELRHAADYFSFRPKSNASPKPELSDDDIAGL